MPARSRWGWGILGVAVLIAGGLVALKIATPRATKSEESNGEPSALVGQLLPSLHGATAWTGGEASPTDSLAGHVAVIAFLSVDLPASLRALPTLAAWSDAYSGYGVRVVGVEVPAFAFAADSATWVNAALRLGLPFAMALDPSLEVWRAYGARGATPRVVVAGPDGRVMLDGNGIEALPQAERALRDLILAIHPGLRFPTSAVPDVSVSEVTHPPVHLGRVRVEHGPLATVTPGHPVNFTAQLRYQVEGVPYTPYPVGRWTPGADGLIAARGGAENYVALRYDAGALGAVLGPAESGAVRLWVLRDERWLKPEEAGADVRFDGRGASYVEVNEPRLYALTRPGRGVHMVKLSPDLPGATIYAFTFEPFESAEARP